MKTIIAFVALLNARCRRLIAVPLIVLWAPFAASATAIYEGVHTQAVQFSHLWSSVDLVTEPIDLGFRWGTSITENIVEGSGAHTVFARSSYSFSEDERTFSQTFEFEGSAGNLGLDESGTSHAFGRIVHHFTFDFGDTPTTFIMRLLDKSFVGNVTLDQPAVRFSHGTGESASVSFSGRQFLFDRPLVHVDEGEFVAAGVTGVHYVRLMTSGRGRASAVYPFVFEVPDTGTTLPLAALSLLSLTALRARSRRES